MSRAVAQLGSAPDWGSGGRRFKSCQPDHDEHETPSFGRAFRAFVGQNLVERFATCASEDPRHITDLIQHRLLGAGTADGFRQAGVVPRPAVSIVYDWRVPSVPSVPSVPVGALCCGDPGDSPDPRNGMCTRARAASVDSHKLFGALCRPMVGNLGDRELPVPDTLTG